MAETYFFYGTLLDADVRYQVLGRRVAGVPAALEGYRRFCAKNQTYPILTKATGVNVTGLLCRGITAVEADRLQHYEGRSYDLKPVTVVAKGRHVPALAFLPHRNLAAGTEWNFQYWQQHFKSSFLLNHVQDVMARWVCPTELARS